MFLKNLKKKNLIFLAAVVIFLPITAHAQNEDEIIDTNMVVQPASDAVIEAEVEDDIAAAELDASMLPSEDENVVLSSGPQDQGFDVGQASAVNGVKPIFNPDDYNSVVFTYWEYVAIRDAKNARGVARPVSESELMRDLSLGEDEAEKIKPPPEERELRLGGLVYRGGSDWAVWLNEKRVTPDAIPKEVLDLKVFKTYIEFKWFDDYTNQIFPIRLRPHQRFNLDARVFLPG